MAGMARSFLGDVLGGTTVDGDRVFAMGRKHTWSGLDALI